MAGEALRVWVELPEEFDVDAHARANAAGDRPDRTPYGLHHLADDGDVELTFRRPLRDPRLAWVARKARNRLGGHEVVAAVAAARTRARREADVVLCMSELTAIPAVLVPGGPPVVSNVIWLGHPEQYPRAQRTLIGRALHRMAAVFTHSEALDRTLVDDWGLDPQRVLHVRLGVDPEFFPPQPWPDTDPIVASVGDDPYRDHDLLIESVRRLRARGRTTTLELGTTIPGITMEPELGVLHRRRLEGQVRDLYRRSGVIGLATRSTNRGTGSTVVLEAAAAARPLVATRTPAIEALTAPDEPGDEPRALLVPPGDPDAFASALAELLDDPPRAQAMGKAARAWLDRTHTTADMARDVRVAVDRGVALGVPRR